jgi:hypothetical protein
MSCKYQKYIRYEEGRIRYLERELKVAGEEINSFKAGNNSINVKDQKFQMIYVIGLTRRIQSPVPVGSLQIMYLMLS